MGKRYRSNNMEKQKADAIITEYLPKIYGFAVKKSFLYQEAEELCSDIVEEVYLSLLAAKEIYNVEGYVWRISQHVYSKFVSSKKKQCGISIDGLEIADETPLWEEDPEEEIRLLRREIAFLTQKRRRIVYSFYYENKSIAQIAKEQGLPEGTVKWHLNKARNELKEGYNMKRPIGKLGMNPIIANGFGHSGNPGKHGRGPEYYLGDKLSLNIVYSVYYEPKTKQEIAEELGMTPVFVEDRIDYLEANGFLVKTAGERYTTYVKFDPETYSQEREDVRLKKKMEIAKLLIKDFVPKVREAVKGMEDVYIPGGNYELLEAAAIFYAITDNELPIKKDLSKYNIKTTDGGKYIASVHLPATRSDPDYTSDVKHPSYWACGDMNRWSEKYPSVYSWSIDSRYSSREGAWQNNLTEDYEYLYEFLTGRITDDDANAEKFKRLRERKFLSENGDVNVMIIKGAKKRLFEKLPRLDDETKQKFVDFALEAATLEANDYPPQMRDLVITWMAGAFINAAVALMVMDILYADGTFKPLTERERITSNLIMFCDTLPQA